jgi:predicted ribosome quality control (RQC) complex YloA/Tae2 family protein
MPLVDRRTAMARALRRYRQRLERKIEALRGDLAEAGRAAEYRAFGETLLVYLRQVPSRSDRAILPDPANPARNLVIPLDPAIAPQANAARYFRRAAKAERGLKQVPPRLSTAEAAMHALDVLLERVRALEEGASDSARADDPTLDPDLEAVLAQLPASVARTLGAPPLRGAPVPSGTPAGRIGSGAKREAIPARLQPRRLKSREGWDVLIGRSNEGNDFLTHRLARSEDYWFHVHGAAGSHVVLRRGKGKNEPSRRTLEEVAAWAAFYSQARTAGKVPVMVTRKRYVRKPRRGAPGLALCTNEKTLIVRPLEPPRTALADAETGMSEDQGSPGRAS